VRIGTVFAPYECILFARGRPAIFGIPRRYSHFVFAVVQSGLTCLIAAGIASLPLMTISQFLTHWLLSGHLLADDAADRGAGNSCNSLCFASSDERRSAITNCDYASRAACRFLRDQQQLDVQYKRV
jgi:hypothetical protein